MYWPAVPGRERGGAGRLVGDVNELANRCQQLGQAVRQVSDGCGKQQFVVPGIGGKLDRRGAPAV
ncbi:hypothetical protein [Catellatospora sichuanensis]|uniref:hypothetical protein n=1 Tax=Catellatospora sichuanensis TaxID=1969805 RepID=UPI001183322D|nr:hypothetical protein [Catellatospora sichuanensis]